MILKLWCKGTNKREDYNGINAEPLTNDEGEGWVKGGEGLKQPFTRISRLYIAV